MDLMTLAAKIIVDDSGFNQGIEGAEKKGKALAGKMSAMTVAVGNIASDMIKKGIEGINNMISGAINGFADYEQLVGGVETLFKSSANRIQKYARESFKTTGLSANEYMETVTSFSASLIQGLKGDTETAAEVANMAVTDMADNANKMGTDISSIQAAYQGFAKQNYTMLDNLKLGYGGTASEMVRLVNDSKILDHEIKDLDGITFDQLVQAIHQVQTNLGVTGTTAKEAADTISGSENSLKAAWKDLLTAVAGTDQSKTDWWNDPLNDTLDNFKESFSTYVSNFVPTLVNTIANSGTLVQGIADAIADLPTTLLSDISEAGLGTATQAVEGVSKVTNWLIDSIIEVFKSAQASEAEISNFGEAIGAFIGDSISKIVVNLPDIAQGLFDIGTSLASGIVEGLVEGLFGGEESEVQKVVDKMNEDLQKTELDSVKATNTLHYLQEMYNKLGSAATRTAEWKKAQADLEAQLPGAGKIWQQYGADIQGAIDALEQFNESTRYSSLVAGMEKARAEIDELWAEQQSRVKMAEAELARAKDTRENAPEIAADRLKKTAEGYLAQKEKDLSFWEYDDDGNRTGRIRDDVGWEEQLRYERMQQLTQGKLYMGLTGKYEDMAELSLDQIIEASSDFLTDIEKNQLDALKREYDRADQTISEATTKLYEAQKELEDTETQREVYNYALQQLKEEWLRSGQKDNTKQNETTKQSVEELAAAKAALSETAEGIDGTQNAIKLANKKIELEGDAVESASGEIKEAGTNAADTIQSGGSTASKAIMTGGEKIGKALDKIAEQLEKFKVSVPKQSGNSDDDSGDSDSSDTQLAVGMDYVPSNGYKAELHEGEAVLTKAENKQRMSGSNADIVGAIQSLRQDLQNLRIVVGQKVFGHAVVDYGGDGLNRYISGANSRYEAGYGV